MINSKSSYVQNQIRKRHRHQGQSVSFNQCYQCKRIVACPYEILKSYKWEPLCRDCKYRGVD